MSSTQISTYDFHNSNIRIITSENNEILFCLADVCAVLQLANPNHAVNSIKEEFSIPTLNVGVVTRPDGSRIEANFITEPQLYFVMMRSRAKVAREFRQWICNKVLPSIRKTGGYTLSQKDKALKELNDRVKELAYEKRAQESSLNLTITCLKDELRKTEAARAFEQKWRAQKDKETGARFLEQEREHEQKIKALECKYGQEITNLKYEIEQLHFQYDKDTATPAQLYEVTKIVHKRAQELGCATALVWRRIHESCKVPSYKQLACWQQFFTAHGHDCVELANLKEPKVLPFDPQGYLS